MMKFKNKKLMLTLLLFIFISSITVVNAVDVSENTTSTDYQVSTVETISVDEQPVDEYNNIESNVNEAKEISKDKPVKSLNGVTHTINSESYSTYFTNGILNNAAQDGDVILIDDTFEDSSFIFDKSITLTSTQNGILRNCIITFNSNADYSNVTNLNIVNINDNANDGINVYSATNMTIEDNTIYIHSNHTAKGITLNNADGTIIYNNDITVNAYTNEVTYYYEANYANPAGTVETAGIGVYNSSYTNVESNIVSMSSTGHSAERDTLVGIAVQGNIVTNSTLSLYPVEVSYNTIQNNIVNLDGNLYAYGITLHYFATNNTIINNTITADSSTKFYVCGIQLSYYVLENQVYDNKINLTALNFTYGINSQGSILSMGYNDFYNNRINLSSIYNRGIESYNGYYDKIRNNVILVDGDYSNGIGLGGIYRNNITYNVINSTGTIFTVSTSSVDDIPFKTDGIYVDSSHYYDNKGKLKTNMSKYNNILNNYILTNGLYAIDLYGSYNNITDNYINSSDDSGEAAVYINFYYNNNRSPNYAYTSPTFLNQVLLLKSNKLKSNLLKSDSLNENGVTTHVITNDNWETFFIMKGLTGRRLNSSLISDNDVLDLQGEIPLDYNIIIDKPLNITSTTNNGKISSSGKTFEINNKCSHSNLTNICLYNTQLILNGADNINIDHINVTNENLELGSGKGVTSIREGCDFINVTNSYFYVSNNGGHSNFVLAGTGFVNVDNNTIHSEGGMVGNVVYLNFYNVINQTNQFINITNNNIIGPTDPAQICWLIGLNAGNDVLIKGNNLTYTGDGIINGVPNLRIEDNNFNNVTNIQLWTDAEIINNTGIHNFEITGAKLVTGNEINGNFVVYGQKDLIVSNNVIKTYNDNNLYNNKIFSEKFVCENNTIDAVLPLNISGSHGSIIQNNTITTTADYSIYLTNSSANIIRNNTLIASNLTGDLSVYGPGDYVENNTPTKGITEYTVANPDELQMVKRKINTGECETDEIIIHFEDDYDFGVMTPPTFTASNKKITIDGRMRGVCNIPNHFIDVGERTTLVIKNFKIDTILYDGMINNEFYDDGYRSRGNITFENCFINFINMTEEETPDPINTFVHSDGTGYISFKSCTIINNIDCYTALTSGNEVYIVNSIILGSDIKLYDADNKPDILEISQNYISSYDKTKYPYVKDEVVAMVNGVADSNTVQVTGEDKVTLKFVVATDNGYDNLINQFGYEDGVFLGSTNEEVINTTGLIFNKSNNYTLTLDENPVDETVTLYTYVLYDNKTDIIFLDIFPEEMIEELELLPEDYTPGTTIDEKKLMDIVEYIPTEETSININLTTLTYGADNQIIINITDMDGNLIETSGPIDVSIDDEEYITYYFKNGELKIPYKITSSDDITIIAAYGGNNQYRRTNTTAIFTPIILDIPTDITITVQTEVEVNSPIPVTIILTADDNLLTGQEVTISTTNGDETIELTKGFIICQYTPTTVGEETIIVTFNSKDHYLASTANATITVTEDKDAIIQELNNTVQEQNSTINDLNNTVQEQTETINTLTDTVNDLNNTVQEQNNTINDLNNTVQEQTETINTLTDTVNDLNNTVQEQNTTINNLTDTVNEQNDKIAELTQQNTELNNTINSQSNRIDDLEEQINQLTAAKDTTLILDPITDAKYNANVTITGMLINDDSIGLSNQVVTLTIGDKTVDVKTRNGVFEYTTRFKTLDEQTITATYAGNDKYLASEDTTSFTIAKQDVVVTYDVIKDVKYGENVTITGKFTDSEGKAISNSNVKITIDGKKYYAKTDKNGLFTLSTKVTTIGENEVTIGYSGNANYNAYETTTTFNVEKQDVIITYDTINDVNVGENVTITGTFKDASGKAVANSNVKIIIDGKKYYAKTDSTGAFTFSATMTKAGVKTVTIGYSGNTNYNEYTSETTFTVLQKS